MKSTLCSTLKWSCSLPKGRPMLLRLRKLMVIILEDVDIICAKASEKNVMCESKISKPWIFTRSGLARKPVLP